MKASDYEIGDRVQHLSDPHTKWSGEVVALHHPLGLVRIAWDGSTKQEWHTPDEIRLKEDPA